MMNLRTAASRVFHQIQSLLGIKKWHSVDVKYSGSVATDVWIDNVHVFGISRVDEEEASR